MHQVLFGKYGAIDDERLVNPIDFVHYLNSVWISPRVQLVIILEGKHRVGIYSITLQLGCTTTNCRVARKHTIDSNLAVHDHASSDVELCGWARSINSDVSRRVLYDQPAADYAWRIDVEISIAAET